MTIEGTIERMPEIALDIEPGSLLDYEFTPDVDTAQSGSDIYRKPPRIRGYFLSVTVKVDAPSKPPNMMSAIELSVDGKPLGRAFIASITDSLYLKHIECKLACQEMFSPHIKDAVERALIAVKS